MVKIPVNKPVTNPFRGCDGMGDEGNSKSEVRYPVLWLATHQLGAPRVRIIAVEAMHVYLITLTCQMTDGFRD